MPAILRFFVQIQGVDGHDYEIYSYYWIRNTL